MNKKLRITTLLIITGLIMLGLMSFARSQPPLPITIFGYVTIQTLGGTNMTAPNLTVYATYTNGTAIPSNEQNPGLTDVNGSYILAVGMRGDNVPPQGTPIDIWVQNISVTSIIADYHNTPLTLNLTVVDTTPPVIQVVWPPANGIVPASQPLWVNATVTDNLVINATSILMALNQTQLVPNYDNTTGLVSNLTGSPTPGSYVANVTVSDIVGNTATKTWNFATGNVSPPTVAITSPTTANPAYTQSGKSVQVTFTYTEASPLNWTITISNAGHTVPSVSNTTSITPGTSTATANVAIDQTAPDGKYNVAVNMYNIYSLNTIATQTNAVVVDNTPPTVTITNPTSGAFVASPVWINGTVADANIGSGQPTINDSRFTLSQWVGTTGKFAFKASLADGAVSAAVNFTDAAGNSGSGTVTFTVDTTPPVIGTPTQVPAATNVQPTDTVAISVSVTDATAGVHNVTLSYNNGTATWYDVPMALTSGLWQGTIPQNAAGTQVKYKITAYDNAGNMAVNDNSTSYFVYTIIPEFEVITALIVLMTFTAVLAVVIKRRKAIKT